MKTSRHNLSIHWLWVLLPVMKLPLPTPLLGCSKIKAVTCTFSPALSPRTPFVRPNCRTPSINTLSCCHYIGGKLSYGYSHRCSHEWPCTTYSCWTLYCQAVKQQILHDFILYWKPWYYTISLSRYKRLEVHKVTEMITHGTGNKFGRCKGSVIIIYYNYTKHNNIGNMEKGIIWLFSSCTLHSSLLTRGVV